MKKFSFLLAMAFAALSFFACKNDISTVTETGTSGEKASIRVGSVSSRSIIPATVALDDFSDFVLTGVFEDEKVDLLTAADATTLTDSFVEVTCGDWEFTLSASLDGETFSDTISQTISYTADNTLSFTLASESTTGSINLSISFTNTDVVKVIASLTNSSGTSATEIPYYLAGSADATADSYTFSEDDSAVCTFTFEETGLEAGDYILHLYFYADGIDAPINKPYHVIKVLPGITTQATLEMIVNDVYTVSFVDKLNSLSSDDITYYSKTGTIILPTLACDGYTFLGWSKSEDATVADCYGGEKLPVSSGNMVFYAVWQYATASSSVSISDGELTIEVSDTQLYQNSIIAFSATNSASQSVTDNVTYTAALLYKGTDINDLSPQADEEVYYYSVESSSMSLNGTTLAIPEGNYQLYVTASLETTSGNITSNRTFDVTVSELEYYEIEDVENLSTLVTETMTGDALIKIVQPTSSDYTDYFDTIATYISDTSYLVNLDLSEVTTTGGATCESASGFQENSYLQSIIFPDDLTAISSTLFTSCTALESITLGKGLTAVVDGGFISDCTALTTINIPEDSVLTYIGTYAFQNCTALNSFTIPSSVIAIGCSAFNGCEALDSITLGSEDGTWYYTTDQTAWSSLYNGELTVTDIGAISVESYNSNYSVAENILTLLKSDETTSCYLYCDKQGE